MDISARLTALAKITRAASPVVSVYLNTRWADEHQRDRVRVFLKKEIRKAGRASGGKEIIRDLEWIQAEGESLIGQARFPDAHGVALFACHALELREVLPVRMPRFSALWRRRGTRSPPRWLSSWTGNTPGSFRCTPRERGRRWCFRARSRAVTAAAAGLCSRSPVTNGTFRITGGATSRRWRRFSSVWWRATGLSGSWWRGSLGR